jgi:hypothetical protein
MTRSNSSAVQVIRRKLDSARFRTWAALGMGKLPNAMIIGSMRCGTTSLWDYLNQHPEVRGSRTKEVHFFDNQFEKGESWYRANFTPAPGETVFLESSPYYLFHPLAPERAASMVPGAKLIVLLRNPVDRTYSHYNQNVQLGLETLPFEEAIRLEEDRLAGTVEDLVSGRVAYSHNHQTFSYLAKSLYARQLTRWLDHFPGEQLLVLKSEDLFGRTQATVDKVTAFLGIQSFACPDLSAKNGRSYARDVQPMRDALERIFEAPNRDLLDRFGIGWD